jgi:RNA polymerase sigma-70 factor (ECF subfamily)
VDKIQNNEVYQGIAKHIPQLRRYAKSLCPNIDRAEDLVQDSLTRALSKSHLFQPGTNLRAWLFTILHRQHISSVRHQRRIGEPVDPTIAVRQMVSPPGQDAAHNLGTTFRKMEDLPRDQREAIEMITIDGLSYGEAAAALQVSSGTIKSRVFRGRAALKEAVEGMESGTSRSAGGGRQNPWRGRDRNISVPFPTEKMAAIPCGPATIQRKAPMGASGA